MEATSATQVGRHMSKNTPHTHTQSSNGNDQILSIDLPVTKMRTTGDKHMKNESIQNFL